MSPADWIERAVAPWTAFVILPLFAFSAMGVRLRLDLALPDVGRMLLGIVLGLVIGKPLGILLAAGPAAKFGPATAPAGIGRASRPAAPSSAGRRQPGSAVGRRGLSRGTLR